MLPAPGNDAGSAAGKAVRDAIVEILGLPAVDGRHGDADVGGERLRLAPVQLVEECLGLSGLDLVLHASNLRPATGDGKRFFSKVFLKLSFV